MTRFVPDSLGYGTTALQRTPGTSVSLATSGPQASSGVVSTSFANATDSNQLVLQTISGSAATYGLDVGGAGTPPRLGANYPDILVARRRA